MNRREYRRWIERIKREPDMLDELIEEKLNSRSRWGELLFLLATVGLLVAVALA